MSLLIRPPLSGVFKPASLGTPDVLGEFWAWWEPGRETGYSNGQGITPLTDQSGNGRHWTQATEASRPTYDTDNALNGHPVATFNTDRFWTGPDMSGIPQGLGATKQGHVFLVVRCDADPQAAGGDTGLWKMTSASDSTHFTFTDGNIYDSVLKGSRENFGNPTAAMTSWRLYEVSAIASSGAGVPDGEYIVKIDGVTQFTGNVVEVNYIAAPTLGRNLGNQGFKGKLAGKYLSTQKFSVGTRDDFIDYTISRFALSVV